jgi:hypothetical protein
MMRHEEGSAVPEPLFALLIAGAILLTFGAAALIAWELAQWVSTRDSRRP